MTATATAARYIARAYYFTNATAPAYWYVWKDGGSAANSGMIGGRFSTPEAAQADADERNAAAAPAPAPAVELGERPEVVLDDDITAEQDELAGAIERVLESAPEGLTPSEVARKVRATYDATRPVLGWMVRHRFAHTSGNGARKRYHAGRG
jgi:hypothetical protein